MYVTFFMVVKNIYMCVMASIYIKRYFISHYMKLGVVCIGFKMFAENFMAQDLSEIESKICLDFL